MLISTYGLSFNKLDIRGKLNMDEFNLDALKRNIDYLIKNNDIPEIILTGSYARGDYKQFSDIDLTCFLKPSFNYKENPSILFYQDNILYSITKTSLESWKEAINDPKTYYYLIHPIKEAIVIKDEFGKFQEFKNSLDEVIGKKIHEKRTKYINENIIGYLEEVHKIMNGLKSKNELLLNYAIIGLILGLANILTVHFEVFMKTENELFQKIQEVTGMDSNCAREFRKTLGIGQQITTIQRAESALKLYLETIKLVSLHFTEKEKQTLSIAQKLIEKII